MPTSRTTLALLLSGLVLLGAGCFGGGSTTTSRPDDLPVEITEIFSTTLPKAIYKARRQQKTSVLVTDPTQEDAPYVRITTDSPTGTTVTVSTRREIEDPVQFLKDAGFESLVAFNVTLEEGGAWSLDTNMVKADELAILIYEIFNNVITFRSTTDWVINLEA